MSRFWRLTKLALPIIGLNILQVLAMVVDTAMLGRLPHATAALAGTGYAVQVLFLLMVFMIGLTVGTVALVARAHGAGKRDRVDHVFSQSIVLCLIVSLVVAVLGNIVGGPIIDLLGADENTRGPGLLYLRPMLVGVFFSYLNILLAAVLRGVRNTTLPFAVAIVANVLNVGLNYVLILGNLGFPALGTFGAALGTVISQGVALALLTALLLRDWEPNVSLRLPKTFDSALIWQLFRVGSPAAMDMVVFNAGFLSIVGMLGSLDQTAVAAHSVGLRIQALAFVPGMAISQVTGALVGNALGADEPREARMVLRVAMVLCLAIMTIATVVLMGLAPQLTLIFNIEPTSQLGVYTVMWIRLLGSCMPFVAIYLAFVGVFQGSGYTRIPLTINVIVTTLMIPASYTMGFPLEWGVFGIWVAFPASFLVKASLAWGFYLRGTWAQPVNST
ncbi:MAG: putative MATE family efflux protein [Kiritimatiellia bacterium]|jgi:putative MATE family efflux protein